MANEQRKFTRIALATNRRWAILARLTETDDWVQVESVFDKESAENLANDLETGLGERVQYIVSGKETDWKHEGDEPAEPIK
jgi:hypothetical protein